PRLGRLLVHRQHAGMAASAERPAGDCRAQLCQGGRGTAPGKQAAQRVPAWRIGKRRTRLQPADRSRIVPHRPHQGLLLCAVAREVRSRGLEDAREICRRARLMKVATGPLVSDAVAPVGPSSAFAWRALLVQTDKALLRLIELAVAALIVVETVVLLAG